jgi:hypothetical protein
MVWKRMQMARPFVPPELRQNFLPAGGKLVTKRLLIRLGFM